MFIETIPGSGSNILCLHESHSCIDSSKSHFQIGLNGRVLRLCCKTNKTTVIPPVHLNSYDRN